MFRLANTIGNVRSRAWRRALCALTCMVVAFPALAEGPRAASAEQLKAVFLINFCRFATWRPDAFLRPDAPITIGIWGDAQLSEVVQEACAGETVGAHAIRELEIKSPADIQQVQVLYVAAVEEPEFEEWNRNPHKNILLVGDSPRFLADGGHIQLASENRVKMRIKLDAVRQSDVLLSSSLLRVAQIVSDR